VSKETGRDARRDRYRNRRDEIGEPGDRRQEICKGDRYRDRRDDIGE
jgi:hypothetical protein